MIGKKIFYSKSTFICWFSNYWSSFGYILKNIKNGCHESICDIINRTSRLICTSCNSTLGSIISIIISDLNNDFLSHCINVIFSSKQFFWNILLGTIIKFIKYRFLGYLIPMFYPFPVVTLVISLLCHRCFFTIGKDCRPVTCVAVRQHKDKINY